MSGLATIDEDKDHHLSEQQQRFKSTSSMKHLIKAQLVKIEEDKEDGSYDLLECELDNTYLKSDSNRLKSPHFESGNMKPTINTGSITQVEHVYRRLLLS